MMQVPRAELLAIAAIPLLLVSCAARGPSTIVRTRECYQLEMGPWFHGEEVAVSEKCHITVQLRPDNQVRIIETRGKGQLPYVGEVGKWSRSGSEILITWGTGFVVTKVKLSMVNSTVVGVGEYLTDTGWLITTEVSGNAVQCP